MNPKNLIYVLVIALVICASSCARSYRAINPAAAYYQNSKTLKQGITIAYQYDEQLTAGNKRYSKKEKANKMAAISVYINNKSNDTVILNETNFQIVSPNGTTIPFVGVADYTKVVNQNVPIYLLYGLAGFGFLRTEKKGEPTTNEIVFNPIPLIIGIGNSTFAHISNKNQKGNLLLFSIFNKPILPGQSLYGIILLNAFGYPELTFYYHE